jgi:hypothetical protein
MLEYRESIVPLLPVCHADGIPGTGGEMRARMCEPERATVLRTRVKDGYYASASMMDAVARRILEAGDV